MWLVAYRKRKKSSEVVVFSFDKILNIHKSENKVRINSIYADETFDAKKDKITVVQSKEELKLIINSFLNAEELELKEDQEKK